MRKILFLLMILALVSCVPHIEDVAGIYEPVYITDGLNTPKIKGHQLILDLDGQVFIDDGKSKVQLGIFFIENDCSIPLKWKLGELITPILINESENGEYYIIFIFNHSQSHYKRITTFTKEDKVIPVVKSDTWLN